MKRETSRVEEKGGTPRKTQLNLFNKKRAKEKWV